jgi:hypothetical protein
MGWRKQHYIKEQERAEKKEFLSGANVNLKPGSDGRVKSLDGFVFRPHFFDRYRTRVLDDPRSEYRTDEEIMAIAVHSFRESGLPKKLSVSDKLSLLVNFHAHQDNVEVSYGLFVVPLKRDRYDITSGKICAVTILDGRERMEYIKERLQ